MAPYEDWNKMDEDEEDELQDTTVSDTSNTRAVRARPHMPP